MEHDPDITVIKLRDGSEWVDHEDCIVGNEQGLKSLIKACETAIEKGEYHGSDLDDYVGVKKLPDNWFSNPEDSRSTRIGNVALGAILLSLVGLILIGGYTVVSWFL